MSAQYNSQIDELIIQLRDCPYSDEFRDCIDSLSLDDLSQDEQTKLMHRINQLQAENREYNKEGREIKRNPLRNHVLTRI
ncbi:MAG: hypothetical protein SNH94_07500 [Rikenellaceae bacterium]